MDDGARAEAARMARQHIFIVNSSPELLHLLRELFQEERYNVTTTNFVPRTFEQIAALGPHLLMIDLVVGEDAGWDLLKRVYQDAATRRIPVLLMSTTPQLLAQAAALEAPGARRCFLVKPFDLDELLAMVDDLIGPA